MDDAKQKPGFFGQRPLTQQLPMSPTRINITVNGTSREVPEGTTLADLLRELTFYQDNYPGAMFSGCGGGYFYVLSDEPVPGGFQVTVRIDPKPA